MKGKQSKLAADTFLEEDLLLDIHLQVHCGMYGGVSKCYVEVHSTIELETLAGVHYIIGILSDCMKLPLQSHATDATFLKRSHPKMVMSAPVSIIPLAGTSWTRAVTLRDLLPLSGTHTGCTS